jgi:hypothetical protein
LRRADKTFQPKLSRVHPEACVAFEAENSFKVEVLTTLTRKDEPMQIPSLGCAAQPLTFLKYLLEDKIHAVALYGPGVLVRVPDPIHFALHKVILSTRRHGPKGTKDTLQASELIQALADTRQHELAEAVRESAARLGATHLTPVSASCRRKRGRSSSSAIKKSGCRSKDRLYVQCRHQVPIGPSSDRGTPVTTYSLTGPPSGPLCSCLSFWPRYCLPSQICMVADRLAVSHCRRRSENPPLALTIFPTLGRLFIIGQKHGESAPTYIEDTSGFLMGVLHASE